MPSSSSSQSSLALQLRGTRSSKTLPLPPAHTLWLTVFRSEFVNELSPPVLRLHLYKLTDGGQYAATTRGLEVVTRPVRSPTPVLSDVRRPSCPSPTSDGAGRRVTILVLHFLNGHLSYFHVCIDTVFECTWQVPLNCWPSSGRATGCT